MIKHDIVKIEQSIFDAYASQLSVLENLNIDKNEN